MLSRRSRVAAAPLPRPLLPRRRDGEAPRRRHALLAPFLDEGVDGCVLPITTPATSSADADDRLAPRPSRSTGSSSPPPRHRRQAALAIDNARLYQQQKQFADTMQHSLLPSPRRRCPDSRSARSTSRRRKSTSDGDVYDFLSLPDGRFAVVLGDVTGHGVDATADMAMAKFVFRSLAREHPEPSDFLAHANDVVVGEIAVGKFITMAYLLIDPRGTVECASAGHPEPRLVLPDGRVESLRCGGLALGIDAPQTYDPVRAELPPGSSVVLYTDGVIEARRGADLFGSERLDALLAEREPQPAQEIADAVVGACRAYAGGDLGDDCAKGMYLSVAGVPITEFKGAGKEFADAFSKDYLNGKPIDPYAIYGAQSASVLLDAIAASDGSRGDVIKKMFATKVTDGLIGSFGFNENGDPAGAAGAVVGFTIYQATTKLDNPVAISPKPEDVTAALG